GRRWRDSRRWAWTGTRLKREASCPQDDRRPIGIPDDDLTTGKRTAKSSAPSPHWCESCHASFLVKGNLDSISGGLHELVDPRIQLSLPSDHGILFGAIVVRSGLCHEVSKLGDG